MTIGIVILVIALIIAPIMAVLPSKEDKAKMQKRRLAMSRGIGVEMTNIEDPDTDPKKYRSSTGKPLPRRLSVAAYRQTRKSARDLGIEWAIVSSAARGRTEFTPGWFTETPCQNIVVEEFLKSNIAKLSGDVVRIEEKNRFVSVYWKESGDVTEVIDFLERCTALDVVQNG
ncbi:MAG: hypothetical protein NPIRA05_22380 [Nitrospirales bacterium]|nr:MAG: hypothetical protein NPIRA05_22380 [Nitrospirales bacterium]